MLMNIEKNKTLRINGGGYIIIAFTNCYKYF